MRLWPNKRWRRAALESEKGHKKGKRDRTRESKFLTPRGEQKRILQNASSPEIYEGYLNAQFSIITGASKDSGRNVRLISGDDQEKFILFA